MSKLSFRARALDPAKPMPIFLAEELPDLPEYSAINRAVPQMPSGMEKEEESEHHLQRAICTGLIIPTPEVFTCDQDFYDRSYPPNYKMPRQMIHMQPLGLEQDIPDYDMDSADEMWVNQQSRRLELTPLKFEQMMDRLEKSSGQTVVTLNEAKALLKQDDEVSIAVYDYWLNKRLKTQHPLILSVKTENRPGTSANSPYLAFRRRTEKMQTRKNRKNDESSYEKMLKLRRDLCRATTVLEMVKRREKTKREHLHLSIEIFEKRVQLRDFSGSLMSELSSTIKNSRPAFAPLYTNQYSHSSSVSSTNPVGGLLPSNAASTSGGHSYTSTSQYLNTASLAVDAVGVSSSGSRKEKRQYKKRKHKIPREKQYSLVQSSSPAPVESTIETEEEDLTNNPLGSEGEDEGQFAFRRNKNCNYHRPLDTYGNWPWESKDDNGSGDKKYRYTLTSIRHPRPRCIGFARRRLGRGGRVILDRAATSMDDIWSELDYTIMESSSLQNPAACQNANPAANPQNQNFSRTCPTTENVSSADGTANDDDDDETISRDSLYVTSFVKPVPIKRSKRKWDYNSFHPKHRTSNNNNNNMENNSISNITNNSLLNEEVIKREKLSDIEDPFKFSTLPYAANVDQQQQPTTSSTYSEVVSDIVKKAQVLPSDRKFNPNEISSSSSFKFSCNSLNEQTYNSINRTTSNIKNYINNNNNNNNNNNDGKPNVISSADVQIKQEIIDSADLNILDDENVNLARLSSYINANRNNAANQALNDALVKIEPDDEMNGLTINNNQLPKSQFTEAKDVLRHSSLKDCFAVNDRQFPFVLDYTSAPPPLSKRMELCNDVLSEIRKDWLHFRPKTPTEELDDYNEPLAAVATAEGGETTTTTTPAVGFSAVTPISIEMQRIARCASPPSGMFQKSGISTSAGLWEGSSDNTLFITNPFTYADLEPDSQLLPSVFASNYLSKSQDEHNLDGDGPNVGLDLNLSGDSLADMNFSLGEDDNENMLDNILQECQIDDLKTLNQTTTFWNGILDDGGAGLLDCIEEKKLATDVTSKHGETGDSAGADATLEDYKDGVKAAINNKINNSNFSFGSSTFSTINGLKDDIFFKKEEIKEKLPEPNKIEPPEEILASPPPTPVSSSATPTTSTTLSIAQPPAHQQLQVMQQQGLLQTTEFPANTSLVNSAGQRTALRVVQQHQQQQQQQQLHQHQQAQQQQQQPPPPPQQQHLLQQNLQLQQKNLVTPIATQGAMISRPHVLTPMSATNHTTIFATQDSNANGSSNMQQKIYLKQSNCNVGGVINTNQVPNNVNQQHNAVILANVKLDNEITCDSLANTIISSNGPTHSGVVGSSNSGIVDTGGGSSSGNGNMIITDNMMTHQTPMIVTTSKPQQQQQQQQLQHQHQQQQQQTAQQIVWRHLGQSGSGIISTDATSNKIVWTSRPAGQKKQLNGPEVLDKLLLSRKISQRKIQIAHQQQQQQQPQQQYQVIKTDEDTNNTTMIDVNSQTTQKTLPTGKVIKMSSYPVVVSELSVQQQQNSAAVAANHNYSLQPSSQPITMISQHSNAGSVAGSSGNKLILTSSGPSGSVASTSNFTIATSSGDMQSKIHYKEIPNTNLKLNFVSTGSIQQGNIVVDSKNTISAQQLNNQQMKTAQQQQQQQHQQQQQQQQNQQQIQIQKMKRERILNIIGGETPDNKRVFYTSLLNLKSLHKNNSGQMQMQISPGMTTVLGKQQLQRIANNPALFANMRVPITNQVVNTQTGASVSGAGTTTAMYTTSASPKTTSNEISVKINNNSNDMATTSSNMNAGTSTTGGTTANNNNNTLSAGINLNTTNR